MTTVTRDFIAFLTKTNAIAVAVGVIIGAATQKVVSSVVADIFMPIIGLVMPAGDWREAQIVLSQSAPDAAGKVTVNALKYGDLIGALVDFVIIAFFVYLVTKLLLPKDPPPLELKECGACLEKVPAQATKCKACHSAV
ncbi:MAG: large conductance mechanosensitive channel protein MscL [Cyanobacteria bacterium SZAS LIN-3]|nr:large conductance mechanosensitive channel protein MscL [Cyanobacteria bacterium SZAS LIN-3]MBS2009158.1 large conductance mechanosensitive channel protein MscL [Cyanobacteria bacterium SZAS TMP-1]